ncbi:MAG: hypothetical protein BMS9Abin23_0169 [Thermodesulfobacteriota bacterium]|nr:MAG: hypothetical protein BMS9Abin23_0169 [Thermodesulfobacteriota bacterium]
MALLGDYLMKDGTAKTAVVILLLSAFTLFIAGCKQTLPEIDSPGAKLYIAKCGICHPPRHPQIHTYKAWKKIVPIMDKRAQESGLRAPLTEEEKAAILEYLRKHARKMF